MQQGLAMSFIPSFMPQIPNKCSFMLFFIFIYTSYHNHIMVKAADRQMADSGLWAWLVFVLVWLISGAIMIMLIR
jgi:hypothetical protein